ALFENPVNPHVRVTVAGRRADEFGYANADILRLRAGNRDRLPSSSGEERAFRAVYQRTSGRGELRCAGCTVELVENAQQLGLVQGQSRLLRPTHPQEHLLHRVEARGNALKNLPASVGGKAQTAQATLQLLKLLPGIELRFRRSR
ncbi:MAG TPA: hypothetical protein VGL87_10210, partial [Steroidobacteraceae bacterium]